MKRVLLLLFLSCSILACAQNPSISFTFTVPAGGPDLRTSAAVLDSTGTMIRTLWGNVQLPPGTYTRTWDGNGDQAGTAATPGNTYTIKLLMNNVTYTYDWWIGATDSSWNSPSFNTRFQASGYSRIAWTGSTGWMAPAYTERNVNLGVIAKTNPTSVMFVNDNWTSIGNQISDLATDGTWVYLMNRGTSSTYPSWVSALDANSGQPVQFNNGTQMVGSLCIRYSSCANTPNGTWPNTTLSVIDSGTGGGNDTGIAVQRTGNILAVAHGPANQIVLYDKRSGASLGPPITGVPAPSQMAFNSEGLWVISGGALSNGLWYTANTTLYEVTGVGSTNTAASVTSLGGITFSNPVSVAVNGATNNLWVLDGGTNQQAYEFAVGAHNLTRTYGVLGGYNDCNPTITPTRLNVDSAATSGGLNANGSFISVDDNDELWIGDAGTSMRVLHISPTNQYVNQIAAPHYNYRATVSKTIPTRVFMHEFEYQVNYGVPNLPSDPDPAVGGNGSWKLVKNWGVCAEGAHGSAAALWHSAYGGIVTVEQLSNGHMYGQVVSASPAYVKVFEFPQNGTTPVRDTGWTYTGSAPLMLRNGNMVYTASTGSPPNIILTAMQATLTGFNSSNNPQYGVFTAIASTTSTSLNASMSPSSGWSSGFTGAEMTTGGYYPIFWPSQKNTSATTHYPHLGGIKSGFSSYAWTSLGEVCYTVPDMLGNYPCYAGFGGHNGVGPVQTEGANIFASYDGQNVSWGDQFFHFWEDGLLVGQFGSYQGMLYQLIGNGTFMAVRPEGAENIGDISTTTVNGDVYLYHPDEAYAPAHRWHISNLSSIHEWAGTGTLAPNGGVTLTQVF